MRALKIFTCVLVLLVISAGIFTYSRWRADKNRLHSALAAINSGSYESGLAKCRTVESQQDRGFCYSYYLGLRIKVLQDQYAANYGENLAQDKKESMQREIQKEFGIVCGYDRNNPYVVQLCGKMSII